MAIAKVVVDESQIRFHIQSALNGFETLSHCPADAIECAKCELEKLLSYLDGLNTGNYTIPVFFVEGAEPNVIFENVLCNNKK